jgi:hypothetical protein
MEMEMRILSVIILSSISLGCSDTEVPLKQNETIPTPVQVSTRPLLDTDLTYYSYFPLDGNPENAKNNAETTLLSMVKAGLVITQAWLGTSGDCNNVELRNKARLVVRLLEANPDIARFDFTGDPAPLSHDYPWVYWYNNGCANKVAWRYDFESGPAVALPEPSLAPREYPVPDSPTIYYRPWYVWGVTDEEWRAGVEAFIGELVREGIPLEQVSVPIGHSDSCLQSDFCNTTVLMITTTEPELKLMQPGIMTESSNCMNLCPVTLLEYQFGMDSD